MPKTTANATAFRIARERAQPTTNPLRRARLAKGWSQDTLAAESKVSQVTISALERGTGSAPLLTTLRKLAKALDVSAASLLEETNDP